MKKVHVTLDIPSEYREWRWLLSSLRREKGRLPSREEIKPIKAETLAHPIAIVEPTVIEGRKKRPSSPAQEMSAEKKPKTFSAAREDLPTTPKLVIDLTSPKGENDELTRSVPVTFVVVNVASSIAGRIAQHISSYVPLVLKFMPKHPFGAKSGSPLKRLAIMKSDNMSLPAKVVPKPISSAVETDSSTEKNETVRADNCEKSTKSISKEAAEICAILRPSLLEDINVCVKFFDGVKRVVGLSSFVKHTTEYKRTALLAMMQKTMILAVEFMFLDQDDTKAAKEMA
ncbi:hypothetical protein ACFXTN_008513 [Malus domestica]